MVMIMIIAIILSLSLNIQFASFSFSYLAFKTKLNVTFLEIPGKINVFEINSFVQQSKFIEPWFCVWNCNRNSGIQVWEILILPELTIWLFRAIFQCVTYERYVICSLNTSFNLSDKPMEEVELLTIIIPFLHLKTETPIQ